MENKSHTDIQNDLDKYENIPMNLDLGITRMVVLCLELLWDMLRNSNNKHELHTLWFPEIVINEIRNDKYFINVWCEEVSEQEKESGILFKIKYREFYFLIKQIIPRK